MKEKRNGQGMTPFHTAVLDLNFDAVKFLIDFGCEINALTTCPMRRNALQLLFQTHSTENKETMVSEMLVSENDSKLVRMVDFLLKSGCDHEYKDNTWNSCLHFAVSINVYHKIAIISSILSMRHHDLCCLNEPNEKGASVIHLLCSLDDSENNRKCLEMILEKMKSIGGTLATVHCLLQETGQVCTVKC